MIIVSILGLTIMVKVKDIVKQLDAEAYSSIEQGLVKNRAENLLFLLKSYRDSSLSDNEILENLKVNSNSFYVLKSRLHDKIENYFSNNVHTDRELITQQLQQIPEICFETPREIAFVFLQKLEKDLVKYDMHNELLLVYGGLKKIFLYSDKYFYYSQLYNKHVALGLSLEKSEEILGNLNRLLSQYNFTRSKRFLDEIFFLRKEILDHYTLNPSRQIEIVKNLTEIQIYLFCHVPNNEFDIEQGLEETLKALKDLPDTSGKKKWEVVLDYLYFEYYRRTGQAKPAHLYYEKVDAKLQSILLYNSVCNTSRFLLSKIKYLGECNKLELLTKSMEENVYLDPEDPYSNILFSIYSAMQMYYSGKIREAVNKLNETINMNSFKDNFHINIEVKLTLTFYYLQLNEFDIADSILKSVYRKIKMDNLEMYGNVLDLIKVFTMDINQKETKKNAKQKDMFTLFLAKNVQEAEVLPHLVHELKKKYF